MRQVAPNARFGYGTHPNQLLIWAKPADHLKIAAAVEKMNEEEAGLTIEVYPLKNTNVYTAQRLVRETLARRGVPASRITLDYYGNQLFVQADADSQQRVADILAKLASKDRDLEVFPLRTVDLETARLAVYALFADESYDASPQLEIDDYTNTLFFRGTADQIDRTRRLLVRMGETELVDEEVGDSSFREGPRRVRGSRNSRLRVIRIEADVDRTIKDIEKLWPQLNRNPLYINRAPEPLIQKKEETPKEPGAARDRGYYSLSDTPSSTEKSPVPVSIPVSIPADVPADAPADIPEDIPVDAPGNGAPVGTGTEGPANVYLTLNDDGSLTIASYDTQALDRLEELLERLHSRVVFEGRDYTIYSVRNVSANDVARKLTLVLRERLMGTARLPQTRSQYGTGYQATRHPLEIVPEIESNTIYVKGSRAERSEVEELIDMFDVSELPGERIVKKPVRVIIKNTQAFRIAQQMLNVYQQKLWMTSLPGGLKPRITIDNLTNAVDIIAPEPLVTELKEYAEELDRRIVEEPARKVHVIPLEVNWRIIQSAMNVIRQSQPTTSHPTQVPYGNPVLLQPIHPGY
ncbi:MAG TPA: hypothetical protein DEB39_00975 [Planctomycetaceae bacterium]|nr:hypothetical protein [Planctomycetaceae bacterium]